jgi:hypothetical protein
MRSFTFTSPFDMANFINKQLNVSDARIEQLMQMGLQHRQTNGTYKITVSISEIIGETHHQTPGEMPPDRGELKE